MTALSRWKSRKELPVAEKLSQYQFDPIKLKQALDEFSQQTQWDGLGSEYASLCENHTKLPAMFFTQKELEGVNHVCEIPWEKVSYQQLGITVWDEDFSLQQRVEKSRTRWDHRVAKNNPEADERWFRKRQGNTPSYLHHVLDTIGADIVHRTRFAKLLPRSRIKPHIDYDTTYGVRLHIPIVTNEKAFFGGIDVEGREREFHMPADGSVWFVNPGLKHWAVNDGETDRVHLIISVDSQKFFS